MSKKLLIESQYFPPIAFFAQFLRFETVFLNPGERFEKQSYRNRCRILTSNKVLDLVVPVQKGKTQLTSGEVGVVYQDKWQQVHLRAIQSAYGRAPYFEHYYPQIEQIVKTERKTIFDLGKNTIAWAARILNIEFQILNNEITDEFIDGRSAIHPKVRSTEFKVQSSKESLNFKLETLNSPYFQCFNHSGFVPNLSIIDLIMNEGPMSIKYIKKVAGKK
ncbi:MAG: WbqC family protein [Bacteroidia bacterium]